MTKEELSIKVQEKTNYFFEKNIKQIQDDLLEQLKACGSEEIPIEQMIVTITDLFSRKSAMIGAITAISILEDSGAISLD